MQEHFKESTNFGQPQWLIEHQYAQRGGLWSESQQGDNIFI